MTGGLSNLEKANKPLPGGAYPNQHDPRDLYNGNPPVDVPTTSRQTFNQRGNYRRLSDYCNIFAEKTNRIGRNVGSFMQSHGLFPARRSAEDGSQGNPSRRVNGDVIRSDYRLPDRAEQRDSRQKGLDRYDRDGSSYSKSVYERSTGANHLNGDTVTQPRVVRQRDYTDLYQEGRGVWRGEEVDLNGSKPILRNGISHAVGEKLYSSTLPRRSRTINFRDQIPGNSLESRRGYPKSLQNLSDLEADDVTRDPTVLSSAEWRDDRLDDAYRRRRYRQDQLEDDYLRLYRNLSSLDKYPPTGRYEPGQVHYERECRTFGKDTVAFIYYKTCYL